MQYGNYSTYPAFGGYSATGNSYGPIYGSSGGSNYSGWLAGSNQEFKRRYDVQNESILPGAPNYRAAFNDLYDQAQARARAMDDPSTPPIQRAMAREAMSGRGFTLPQFGAKIQTLGDNPAGVGPLASFGTSFGSGVFGGGGTQEGPPVTDWQRLINEKYGEVQPGMYRDMRQPWYSIPLGQMPPRIVTGAGGDSSVGYEPAATRPAGAKYAINSRTGPPQAQPVPYRLADANATIPGYIPDPMANPSFPGWGRKEYGWAEDENPYWTRGANLIGPGVSTGYQPKSSNDYTSNLRGQSEYLRKPTQPTDAPWAIPNLGPEYHARGGMDPEPGDPDYSPFLDPTSPDFVNPRVRDLWNRSKPPGGNWGETVRSNAQKEMRYERKRYAQADPGPTVAPESRISPREYAQQQTEQNIRALVESGMLPFLSTLYGESLPQFAGLVW